MRIIKPTSQPKQQFKDKLDKTKEMVDRTVRRD